MKPGAGKVKGSRFEREVCKTLSLWWSEGKIAEVFWREGSGSKSTVTQSMHLCGDIFQFNHDYPFLPCSVELKFHKDFEWDSLFENSTGKTTQNIPNWWDQCVRDAERAHHLPVLIFKKNYRPPFIALPYNAVPPQVRVNVPHIIWNNNFIGNFEEFLRQCTPKEFRKMVRRRLRG
jgi:hypothetical protein